MAVIKAIGAVDIGGTKIAAGIVNSAGVLLAGQECPTSAELGPQNGLSRMVKMLGEAAATAGCELIGVGIGCTGPVDPFNGEVGEVEFLRGWEGFNLVEGLSRKLGVEVRLENDADAAALGEARWGTGKGSARFIYVTISTGIGVGVVFDGKLYRGVDGAHPEIGHHIIDPSGPLCTCGANGCWESLASGPAMVNWLADPRFQTALEICQAAEAGDLPAQKAVERVGYFLGLGLANLVTLFIPDTIALGGGVMKSYPLFEAKIHQMGHYACGYVPADLVKILPASLGSQVGLVGAASVWLHASGQEI